MSGEHDMVASYVRAMERGSEGVDQLVALFAPDAIYVEPFSGQEHRGVAAIRAYLEAAARGAPPAIRLEVTVLRVESPRVEVEWTCHSPAFVTPSRGRDHYEVVDGRIRSLRTELIEPPTFAEGAAD
jgi:ketosteroid isomerase-like protein